jgi:GNAT superfamily N-acetyltransferase
MEFKIINQTTGANPIYTSGLLHNFYLHISREYGDKIADILKCIDYVMHPDKGGNIVIGVDDSEIVGIVILNNTGMKDFIPENILVYIAVDNNHRGKGYGKQLMQSHFDCRRRKYSTACRTR